MDTGIKYLGRTRDEWRRVIANMTRALSNLEPARRTAIDLGQGEKAREIEKEINITRGTLIAAKQVLQNPPFSEQVDW